MVDNGANALIDGGTESPSRLAEDQLTRMLLGSYDSYLAASFRLAPFNPDALIVRTNLSGARVDAGYLAGLSDDGIPTLIDRLPSLAPPLRQQLAVLLLRRRVAAESWASFNFARDDAYAALARAHSELEQLAGRGPTLGR